MRTTRLLPVLSLLSSITGCGTLFSARATVTPTQANANVQVDSRVAAVAGLVGAGIAAAQNSDVQVGAPVNAQASTNASATVSTTATTTVASSGRVHLDEAGDVSTTAGGATGVGGVSATSGVAVNTGANVSASTGANVGANAGTGVALGGATGASTSATVSVSIGRVDGVAIDRVATNDGHTVLAGGRVTLVGVPTVAGLTVLDGSITVHVGVAASATVRGHVAVGAGARGRRGHWDVPSGRLLLGDAAGHRWRCDVTGGAVDVATEGANPEGLEVWSPSAGSIQVHVTAEGDARLALSGELGAQGTSDAGRGVALPPGAMAALDDLLGAVPAGSIEALKLASAVQVVMRGNASTDPSFFTVPVRGRSLVVVVDVSASMADDDPRAADLFLMPDARPRKLDVARAELVKLIGSVGPDVQVDVIAFSSSLRTLWPAPVTLDAAHKAEAIRWIAGLRPLDETAPVAAIEAAAGLHPEQVVLLSDGRPTDREDVARELLGLAAGISTRIRLDVVGIGPDQDRVFLAALADRGHGILRMR